MVVKSKKKVAKKPAKKASAKKPVKKKTAVKKPAKKLTVKRVATKKATATKPVGTTVTVSDDGSVVVSANEPVKVGAEDFNSDGTLAV